MKVDYYVKRYLKGDGESFDMIYELTKKDVYLSIYVYFKDKATIEDLMQDVYVKVINSIDSYEIGSNFNAWISRIARNITINYYNKNKRVEVKDPVEDNYVFDKKVNNSRVDLCLSYLVGIERDVFVLRVLLGYRFNVIDKTLELNPHQSYYIFKKLTNKLKEIIWGVKWKSF